MASLFSTKYPFSFLFCKDGLNLSSSQTQQQQLNNRTMQNFVEAYVDRYMGECTMATHIPLAFVFYLSQLRDKKCPSIIIYPIKVKTAFHSGLSGL